jgi:hypothetical protein
MQLAARVLTSTMSNDGSADDVAVGQMPKVELDAGTEEPVEWHLVDGHHRLAVF